MTKSQDLEANATAAAKDRKVSPEQSAKAALIQHLRDHNEIRRDTSLMVELGVGKYTNRVDVVTVGTAIHSYEIKTKRDTLTRLEKQVSSYLSMSDFVTVVASTRHVNALISKLEDYVGIFEIVDFGSGIQIREIRKATHSPMWSPHAALDLLPATEIRSRLLPAHAASKRDILLGSLSNISDDKIRTAVVSFLRERYKTTTKAFNKSTKRRDVTGADLQLLRLWHSPNTRKRDNSGSLEADHQYSTSDAAVYLHIGGSFGPVPDEVRMLIKP